MELSDLRGDLHSHSTWSADGKNTIEEMARACMAKGYRYLVVTDHSHYLRDGKLEAQWKEIDALNEQLDSFQLLKGIEVNIRADGSLDMSDDLLALCDWVVASVHSSLGSDVTDRITSAMQSPHVDSIGHPTGRKLNRREPSDLDFERVVETAVETGTFLEIDSQPDRLDLRDTHARAAADAGLKIAITSDAHQISALDYVEIGIGQARRAWLTKDQVLNTRTWPQLKKLRKREVKYRAVVFDLWNTLVVWPEDEGGPASTGAWPTRSASSTTASATRGSSTTICARPAPSSRACARFVPSSVSRSTESSI